MAEENPNRDDLLGPSNKNIKPGPLGDNQSSVENKINELAQLLGQSGLLGEISEMNDAIQNLDDACCRESEKRQEKRDKKDEKTQKEILKVEKKTVHEMANLSGEIKGSGPIHPVTPEKTLEEVANVLRDILIPPTPPTPPTPPPPPTPSGDGGGEGGGPTRPDERDFANRWSGFFTRVSSQILGGYSIQDLFSGSINDVVNYRKEMRQLAWEIEGITGDARGLQKEFANIGSNITDLTGMNIEETQKAYKEALKKGVKSRKEALKVVKTSLHTSYILGSDAQQTANLFSEWHRTLGMTAAQMEQMARDSREIAKSTGISGDELLNVMKRSQNIMKNLRDQGNLTSSALNNIIKGAAEAEKLGVGEGYNKLVDAMTDSHKLFTETDAQTRNLIMRIGGEMGSVPEIINGTFFESRDNMKKFAAQMETDFVRAAHQIGATQVQSMDDFNKMDANQRALMNRRMKQMYGMSAADFIKQSQSVKKGSEGLSDAINNMNKKLAKDSVATIEERALAEKQVEDGMRNASMRMTNQMSQNIEKGMSVAEAAKAALKDKTIEEDLRAMATHLGKNFDLMNDVEKAQLAASVASEKIAKKAKEFGITTVEVMGKGGKMEKMNIADIQSQYQDAIAKATRPGATAEDKSRVRDLESAMSQAQMLVDKKEKDKADPITETNQLLLKTNEYLRDLTSGILGDLIDTIGSQGLIFLGFGAALIGWIPGLAAVFGGLLSGLGGIFAGLLGGLGGLFRFGDGSRGGGVPGPFGWLGNWLSDLGRGRAVRGAATLALLAASLFLVAKGLKEFNSVNWESFAKGALALGGLIVFAKFIGRASTSMLRGAAVLAILAGSLIIAAYALKSFNDVNFDSVLKGSIALGALAISSRILSDNLTGMIKGAIGIAALGGAMWVAAKGFNEFNDVHWESLIKGALAIAGLTVAAVVLSKFAQEVLLGAAGMVVLAGALWLLGKALQTFNGINWTTLGIAAVALIGFATAAGIMGIPPILAAIIAGSAAIGILGVAIGLFGLGLIPVAYAMKLFMESFNSFIGGIMQLASIDSMKLFMIGPALMSIGVGALVFALGMAAATAGDLFNRILGFFGAKSPLERIKEFVPIADKIDLIGRGFKNFGDGIKAIADALKELNTKKLSELKKSMDEFVKDEKFMDGLSKIAGARNEKLNVQNLESDLLKMAGPKDEKSNTLIEAELSKATSKKGLDETLKGQLNIESISTPQNQPQIVSRTAEPIVQPTSPAPGAAQTLIREKTGAESGVAKLQSDELTRLEKTSMEQTHELELIKDGIYEMVALLKPSGSASLVGESRQPAASTRDFRRPAHSPIMGKIKMGLPSDGANRSILNKP